MLLFPKILSYLNSKSKIFLVLYLLIWVGINSILVHQLPKGFSLPNIQYIYQKNNNLASTLTDPNIWSTTFGIVALTLFEIILVSLLMFIISKLFQFSFTYQESLTAVILSHSVFLLQFISEFIFIKYHPNYFKLISRDKFSLFSIQFITDEFQIKHAVFLDYLFQTINLFEILYWIILSFFFSKAANKNLSVGLKLVVSSYVPILFIWLLFVSLILLLNS
jgi:hypothetical protein